MRMQLQNYNFMIVFSIQSNIKCVYKLSQFGSSFNVKENMSRIETYIFYLIYWIFQEIQLSV